MHWSMFSVESSNIEAALLSHILPMCPLITLPGMSAVTRAHIHCIVTTGCGASAASMGAPLQQGPSKQAVASYVCSSCLVPECHL